MNYIMLARTTLLLFALAAIPSSQVPPGETVLFRAGTLTSPGSFGVFDLETGSLAEVAVTPEESTASGVIDPATGVLFALRLFQNDVLKLELDGTDTGTSSVFGSVGANAQALTLDGKGDVIVVDSLGVVRRLDRHTGQGLTIAQLNLLGQRLIEIDPSSNRMWIVDSPIGSPSTLYEFDLDDEPLQPSTAYADAGGTAPKPSPSTH